jgi:uncharacterized protein YndB with AHSA1/START domain
MNARASYKPSAGMARMEKKPGDMWTLVLVKSLRHSPDVVWSALTDPAQLKQWAPYDADKNLTAGANVKLTTVGAPQEHAVTTTITRADKPKLLEYRWGEGDMRWELEAVDSGTRLTLWSNIDRRYIAMGAAGWHLCLDVLEHELDGDPMGRIVGMDALKFDGWKELQKQYLKEFGGETPEWLKEPS